MSFGFSTSEFIRTSGKWRHAFSRTAFSFFGSIPVIAGRPRLNCRDPYHSFLDHDSFLECNLPFELTEYDIEQSIKTRGIVGRIHQSLAAAIYEAVKQNRAITHDDMNAMRIALIGGKHI